MPNNNNDNDPGTIHELKAFGLGNIISVGLGIEGMGRLPNPPISKGMIIREIVNIPWKVMHGLCWRVGLGMWPGRANSNLIVLDDPIPVGPPIKPGNICNAPISIWLVTGRIKDTNPELHTRQSLYWLIPNIEGVAWEALKEQWNTCWITIGRTLLTL